MNKRRAWWGFVVAMASAIVFAGWFPGYRLEREIAAARREGLWTELGDIPKAIAQRLPPGENAAEPIRKAIRGDAAVPKSFKTTLGYVRDVNKGTATAYQKQRLRELLKLDPGLLFPWRVAASHPRLDYGRKWEDGYGVLFPEYAGIKAGALRLVAAARLGIDPKANLLAAARLSALTRQEPSLIGPLVSVSIGHSALREAKRQGLGREIGAALGPPIDVRWAYASEFPAALDTMRRVGSKEWYAQMGALSGNEPFWEKIRHIGPWRANAAWRLVHSYRALGRELPRDGTDYDGAYKAVNRRMPEIYGELASASYIMGSLMGDGSDAAKPIESFKKYAKEREDAKAQP